MASPELVAVGDVMVDISVSAEALARGGHVQGQVRVRPGGSAANVAVWAAELGAAATVVGRIGADLPGRLIRAALEERGVRTFLTVDPDAPTGAFAQVGETVLADPGANARFVPADVPARLEAGAVVVSGYSLLQHASQEAALAGLTRAAAPWVAVDAASASLIRASGTDRFFELTTGATVLLANEDESHALTGLDADGAVRTLGKRYRAACVKLGARGAVAALEGVVERTGSPVVEVVNPVGAGDAFAAGLLVSLARGRPLTDALTLACDLGGRAVASPDPWPRR